MPASPSALDVLGRAPPAKANVRENRRQTERRHHARRPSWPSLARCRPIAGEQIAENSLPWQANRGLLAEGMAVGRGGNRNKTVAESGAENMTSANHRAKPALSSANLAPNSVAARHCIARSRIEAVNRHDKGVGAVAASI